MGELRQSPLREGRIEQLIRTLEAHRKQFPLKRKLTIVLGRLYAEGRKEYEKSTGVLQDFVDKKLKAGEVDEHVADALFNIACNFSKKLEKADAKGRREFGTKALNALEQSVKLSPLNAKDILTDEDLKPLRESEEFKAQVATLVKSTDTNISHGSPPAQT